KNGSLCHKDSLLSIVAMRVRNKDVRPRKLCSIQSGNRWPQRSQLQPGVPSLRRCVTLLPATFCNLGWGDSLSSFNKRIVLISYSFLLLQSLLRPKSTRDDLKLPVDPQREDVVLFFI